MPNSSVDETSSRKKTPVVKALVKGPLFVAQKGFETARIFSGSARRDAQQIAECRTYWDNDWELRVYGLVLGHECFCYASSDDRLSISPGFPGVAGDLVIGTVNASFRIFKSEPFGYRSLSRISASEKSGKWSVCLDAYWKDPAEAKVFLNKKLVARSPTSEKQGFGSLARFVPLMRRRWGDWLKDPGEKNQIAAAACLICVAVHVSSIAPIFQTH
jgi:hypothetical protein